MLALWDSIPKFGNWLFEIIGRVLSFEEFLPNIRRVFTVFRREWGYERLHELFLSRVSILGPTVDLSRDFKAGSRSNLLISKLPNTRAPGYVSSIEYTAADMAKSLCFYYRQLRWAFSKQSSLLVSPVDPGVDS